MSWRHSRQYDHFRKPQSNGERSVDSSGGYLLPRPSPVYPVLDQRTGQVCEQNTGLSSITYGASHGGLDPR